ncbi:hypothetical protein ACC692_38080, partial [Rhizobium ruizarguesonis]
VAIAAGGFLIVGPSWLAARCRNTRRKRHADAVDHGGAYLGHSDRFAMVAYGTAVRTLGGTQDAAFTALTPVLATLGGGLLL